MPQQDFSLADLLRSAAAGTWNSIRSPEHRICDELAERYGHSDVGLRVPFYALRDLNVANAGGAGFTVGTEVSNYVDTLRPASAALRLGARVVTYGPGNQVVVTGQGGATVEWLQNETDAPTESTAAFAGIASTPKLLSCHCEISYKLLKQTTNVEAILRRELRNAAAAELDRVLLGGSGNAGEPTGLTGAPTGTFTGAALTYAEALNATEDVAANAVSETNLGWICPPATATVLAQRVKLANTQPFLWEGNAVAGTMLGARALSTASAPAATLFFGDWSAAVIATYESGLQIAIELDPNTKFSAGIVGVRLLLPVDIIIERPPAFSVGTSVS